MKTKSPLFAGLLLAFGFSAHAATLDIDFRSPAWAGADGSSSPFSIGDVTLGASFGTFTHSTSDGLGIDGGTLDFGDEISYLELFTVSFANGFGSDLTGVLVTDLYVESGLGTEDAEVGYYSLNSGGWVPFYGADSELLNGEQYLSFGGATDVSTISFGVGSVILSGNSDPVYSDFGVAGFSRASVPDSGASLALLGASLLGLGGVRRFFGSRA